MLKKYLACAVSSAALVAAMLPASLHAQTSPRLGIDVENFDTSVRPQDDFYRYVNGTWLKETEIPADRSNYGAFTELVEEAEHHLRAIIEEAAAATSRPAGSDVQKVGDLYLSFMDSARVEALGLSPLKDDLARIDAIETKEDLVRYFGYAQRIGAIATFGMWVEQDEKNTTQYALYLNQGGLGLPDRDYYFGDKFKTAREQYVAYIENLFDLAGWDGSADAARTIMNLETRLAQHHWTQVQSRDRTATYNKYTIKEGNTLTPALDWSVYFTAAEAPGVQSFIVQQPSYFEALSKVIADVPVQDWQTYLRFRVLSNWAPYLPQKFVDAHFDFFSRNLSGIEENSPRWKRGVSVVEDALGEMVGKMYVERHFSPVAKQRMDELTANLREAFRQAIDELEWMTPATKKEAQAKLAKFNVKIGYPEKWKDYSALTIERDDLVGNLRRAAEVEYRRSINKLGKPVDRTEWLMTPQTVNAYYYPPMNDVVFPAAILQPPFFNVEADDAVNYGAIGAVIGHELSHGFDDQGRRSDGDGNLRDWWTPEDEAEFKKRAQGLIDQYNAYSPIEGMYVKGDFTLGENIGDLAGLAMAYRAYKLSLGGKEAPVIDGFTGDQRFFMGWAQVWRRKYRESELRKRLVTDPHAPSEYRANGILVNMPEFYEAFDIEEGDAMYRAPADRVKIW